MNLAEFYVPLYFLFLLIFRRFGCIRSFESRYTLFLLKNLLKNPAFSVGFANCRLFSFGLTAFPLFFSISDFLDLIFLATAILNRGGRALLFSSKTKNTWLDFF